jgi:hypothetical protein
MNAGDWVLVFIAFLLAPRLLWAWRQRADARRRAAERLAYEERKREQEQQRFMEQAERYYPFIGQFLQPLLDRGVEPAAALRQALAAVPGVTIGITQHGLPAVLAHQERVKHIWLVARSGFGKTSVLTNVVARDLLEGRGLCAVCCETEWFRDYLLGLVPESRINDVIYLAPGQDDCPLTFNPLQVEAGDDPTRVAAELALVLRRAVGEEQSGVRTGPIIRNVLTALTGRPGVSLWSILRFFRDEKYRESVLQDGCDPYTLEFFRETFPRLPRGSELPLIYRLDQFLGRRSIQRCLCGDESSFSVRRALAENLILFVDLGNLDPDSQNLIAGLFLSQLQLAAFRRENVPQSRRPMFPVFIDELQTVTAAEAALLTMLARGRRMGLAICAANQHPGQLSKSLRDGLLGTISSLLVMNVDAADASALRKELLYIPDGGDAPECVPVEHIVTQRVGEGVCRLGSGAFSLMVKLTQPIPEQPRERGEAVKRRSWETFGARPSPAAPMPSADPPSTATHPADAPPPADELSETDLRFLRAVVVAPGQASAEYAKAAGLNGTRAAETRKRLVERGYLKEHRLARKTTGKPAMILEPLEPALQAIATEEAGR